MDSLCEEIFPGLFRGNVSLPARISYPIRKFFDQILHPLLIQPLSTGFLPNKDLLSALFRIRETSLGGFFLGVQE